MTNFQLCARGAGICRNSLQGTQYWRVPLFCPPLADPVLADTFFDTLPISLTSNHSPRFMFPCRLAYPCRHPSKCLLSHHNLAGNLCRDQCPTQSNFYPLPPPDGKPWLGQTLLQSDSCPVKWGPALHTSMPATGVARPCSQPF